MFWIFIIPVLLLNLINDIRYPKEMSLPFWLFAFLATITLIFKLEGLAYGLGIATAVIGLSKINFKEIFKG